MARARSFERDFLDHDVQKWAQCPSGNARKYWCRNPDSNWGPTHYECVALPTELLRHAVKRPVILPRGALRRKAADALVHLAQGPRERKNYVLFAAFELLGHLAAPLAQLRDDALDQDLGRRGAGGDSHGLGAVEPFPMQMLASVDQIARDAALVRHLAQPIGIRARLRSDHHQSIATMDQVLDRVLTILSGIADVLLDGRLQPGKAVAQRLDDGGRIIHRERRLSDERKVTGVAHLDGLHVLDRLDQIDAAAVRGVELADRAFDFRVPRMTDE